MGDVMNSARRNFAFATRLILVVFLLLLVAPHAPAQQGEKEAASPEPILAPQTASNQRPSGGQPHGNSQGSNNPNAGRAQPGPSSSGPTRPSSSRDSAGERGPSRQRGEWRGSAANAPAPADSANETHDGAPIRSNDRPGRRGPAANGSARPGSSNEATNSRGQSNSRPGRHGASGTGPARPESATDATADKPKSQNGRPGRGGQATDRPRGPGSRNNAGGRPGNATNADEKHSPGPAQPRGGKGGVSRTTRANGTVVERDKSGRTTAVTTRRGTTARMDSRGQVTSIRDKSGNTISRGPRGERKVETVRADRTRVVTLGRRGGYVERPFDRGGRQYVRRTYVVGGRSYVRVYRGHYYHGRPYYVYVPPYYYAPAYYRWMYGPWPRPVYYHWGWYGSIWYRPYGYYFAPYPVYPYASLWLTDYLIAENLRLAYEADNFNSYQPSDGQAGIALAAYHPANQANGDASKTGSAVLTPQVKQMIADEVKGVIAEQQKAAGSPNGAAQDGSGDERPAALDANHRLFVVFSVVEATANNDTCSLTASDVVKRIEDTPDSDNTVAVQILASKKGNCAIGSRVRVDLGDLNDMLNHLREQVDAGMKILAEKQGKDGLPAAPPADPRAVPEGMATPDPTAAADLQKQEQEADQTEQEVQQEASFDNGSGN